MKQPFINPVFLRSGMVILLSLFLSFILLSIAHADPPDEQHGPTYTDGTVHMTATVPEGFSGTVSVQLSNVETGDLYTVTCYASAGHDTYEDLPLGTYLVERAFTSEDSFVYEAFTEYFEFTLGTFQELSVDVTHNKDAQAYLDDQTSQQGTVLQQPGQQGSASQQGDTTPVPDEGKDILGNMEQPDVPSSDTPLGETQNAVEEVDTLHYIGKVVIGTVAFTAIVFGIVFLVRKKMRE